MHVEINARFDLDADSDKTLPVATLAELLTEQHIEARLLEAIVESLDELLVEDFCGEKHATGNGDERFQRRGTKSRSAVTTAGQHDFSLHYVEDTAADHNEDSYFRPVEDLIDFDGQKQYQQDISVQSADLATTLSYRDAADHGDGIETMPSPATINRRVKNYGSKLTEYFSGCLQGTEADTVIPDGTKCYSQDEDRSYHDVQVTLQEDTDDESTSLLDVSVNGEWEKTASSLGEIDAITDDATVVSDGERRIIEAFTDETREHQRDLVHIPRTLSYKLWEDGVFSLEDRREIVSEVADEVFYLKNSVEKHRPEGESSAIRERIARTKERLSKTAWQLEQFSSVKAAAYLRTGLSSMMTFAEAATTGVEVPWTSNPVERAMGEITKRCKRDWMRWTEVGLETLLQLLLVKYANSAHYRAFVDDLLQRSIKTTIKCNFSVEATGGKL